MALPLLLEKHSSLGYHTHPVLYLQTSPIPVLSPCILSSL
uniref:Uncharacterized protein n=1 Tax=Solanum lycopersicum TaxID=4081 RepID=K4BKI2_SOLLC